MNIKPKSIKHSTVLPVAALLTVLLAAGCASTPPKTHEEVPQEPSEVEMYLSYAQGYLGKQIYPDAIVLKHSTGETL